MAIFDKKFIGLKNNVLNQDDPIVEHREALKKLFPLPELPNPKPKKSNIKAVKAAALIVMIMAFVIWMDPIYHSENIITAIGERKEVVLADNSQLTLDTNTTLRVEYHLRTRQITLAYGQALFDVSSNKYRPFYVHAGSTSVRVVGTMFNVMRKDRQVSVVVLRGKVLVMGKQLSASAKDETYLNPGEQVISTNGTLDLASPVDVASLTAWKNGKFIFENTPLLMALTEIQRYRAEPITTKDIQSDGLQISGVFNIDETDALLHLLPKILPVKVRIQPDGAVYVSAKSE